VFREAIDAIFGDQSALVVAQSTVKGHGAALADLRLLEGPEQLSSLIGSEDCYTGQFFHPAPDWLVEQYTAGSLQPGPLPDKDKARLLGNSNATHEFGGHKIKNTWRMNRMMVVEIDYLFVNKFHNTPEIRALQAEAVAFALQATGFPYAALVHSGNKSVHAFLRFHDDEQTIYALRDGRSGLMKKVLAALTYALGDIDRGVSEFSGSTKLVRTPGAVRYEIDAANTNYINTVERGREQSIISVGQSCAVQTLIDWCYNQLDPSLAKQVQTEPAKTKGQLDHRPERLPKNYANTLLQPREQGERGSTWRNIAFDIATAGSKAPRLIDRPSSSNYWGSWDASFLWWVSAYVYNQMTGGWFFSHGDDWSVSERCRWPNQDEVKERQQANLVYSVPEEKRGNYDEITKHLADRINETDAEYKKESRRIAEGRISRDEYERGGNKKGSRKGPPQLNPELIGDDFIKAHPTFKQYTDPTTGKTIYYEFNGKFWESSIAKNYIKSRIYALPSVGSGASAGQVGNCLSSIECRKEICVKEPLKQMSGDCIVFNNGTLYAALDDWEFMPDHFDPGDYARYALPFDYDMDCKSPVFDGYLESVLPNLETRKLLQEYMGYCLIPYNPKNKFLINYGEKGSNGKSTFTTAIKSLFGDLLKAISLAGLGRPFALAGCESKMLLIDDDVSDVRLKSFSEGATVGSVLKAATGNSEVEIEIKRGPKLSVRLPGKFIFNCNEPPTWATTSGDAFWRRPIIIPWNQTFKGRAEDPQMLVKLQRESAGILAWMLRGLHRLCMDQGFEFTHSQEAEDTKLQFKSESDPVGIFLQQFTSPMPEDHKQYGVWCKLSPLMQCFNEWSEAEMGSNHNKIDAIRFARRLNGYGVDVQRPMTAIGYFPLGENATTAPTSGRFGYCFRNLVIDHPDFGAFAHNQTAYPIGDEPIRGPGYIDPRPPGAPPSA
jgi:hypothetical protein